MKLQQHYMNVRFVWIQNAATTLNMNVRFVWIQNAATTLNMNVRFVWIQNAATTLHERKIRLDTERSGIEAKKEIVNKATCDGKNTINDIDEVDKITIKNAFLVSITNLSRRVKEIRELIVKRKLMVLNLMKQPSRPLLEFYLAIVHHPHQRKMSLTLTEEKKSDRDNSQLPLQEMSIILEKFSSVLDQAYNIIRKPAKEVLLTVLSDLERNATIDNTFTHAYRYSMV
ncbi:unnamed protein product [Mytilus coruscus]|uniref:Uncharacterized protein n=1 Tax=Mytilus coruscus TaxID=42192 RepID=A0A6J8BUA9_MYTCO|nr:unnamed protein product [Mytilus coruscus]